MTNVLRRSLFSFQFAIKHTISIIFASRDDFVDFKKIIFHYSNLFHNKNSIIATHIAIYTDRIKKNVILTYNKPKYKG